MHTKYSRIKNSFVAPPYGTESGSLPDWKTLPALPAILLFMLTPEIPDYYNKLDVTKIINAAGTMVSLFCGKWRFPLASGKIL